jgi:lipopolysaccharide biosynthesis regulator YciM
LDEKERNEALKFLIGGTIVFFVFVMIVTPQLRANWVGVLVGSFVFVLIAVAVVYGRRGSEEEEAEEVEEESEETDAFIGTAKRLGIDTEDKTREQIMDEIVKATTPNAPPASQQVVKEIYKEREVITREIVKVRCRHCGYKFDEASNYCPHCGAPS